MMSMSVNVTTNSPSQEYIPPDDHTSWTYGYNFKEKMELCLNKHALNFALFQISIQAFFKFEFIKFGLSYPGRLFIIWLATSVFKSKFSAINFNFNSISQNSHG